MQILKKIMLIGMSILFFIVCGILVICLVDWNHLRQPIATATNQILGRPLNIKGDLVFTAAMKPSLRAYNISMPQPSWSTSKHLFSIGAFEIELDIPESFEQGTLVINSLSSEDIAVNLEQSGQKKSWQLKGAEEEDPEDSTPSEEAGEQKLPFIKSMEIKNIAITHTQHDDSQTSHIDIPTFSIKGTDAHTMAMALTGKVNRLPFAFEGTLLQKEGENILKEGIFSADQTRIFIAATVIPQKIPYLNLNIDVPVLDLDQVLTSLKKLEPETKTPSQSSKKKEEVTSSKDSWINSPLPMEVIKAIDSDVSITVDSIVSKKTYANLLKSFSLKNSTKNGRMNLEEASLVFHQGQIRSSANIDANAKQSAWKIKTKIDGVAIQPVLQSLLAETELPAGTNIKDIASGQVYGTIDIGSTGDMPRTLIEQSQGSVQIVLANAEMHTAVFQLLEFDAVQTLTSLLRDDKTISITCAINLMKLNKGILTSEASLLATKDTSVFMKMTSNLLKQHLDLTIIPIPKSLSITGRQTPIFIKGPFTNLKISLSEPKDVVPEPPSVVEAVQAAFSPIKDWEQMIGEMQSCGPLRAEIRRVIKVSDEPSRM